MATFVHQTNIRSRSCSRAPPSRLRGAERARHRRPRIKLHHFNGLELSSAARRCLPQKSAFARADRDLRQIASRQQIGDER
jgi:hypothetical protein